MKTVITLDQSTAGTKAALVDETGMICRTLSLPHRQMHPAPGRVEHDAEEIWQNTVKLLKDVMADTPQSDILGLGIANQRETTVVWDRKTGKPVAPAIVWQDIRAKTLTDTMQANGELIEHRTGLKLSPYYSAAKAAALLDEQSDLKRRAENGELCFGTIDSYLLYRLTDGRMFATDVSNASRTQLFNLETLQWDRKIVRMFGLSDSMLPEQVLSSDADFGWITAVPSLKGIHIRAMMGDSHASFYGHGCTLPGTVKTSYGTGSSVMMNSGRDPSAIIERPVSVGRIR